MIFAACGGSGSSSGSKPTIAPSTVPPTFVRISVTPRPTGTPVPAAPPNPTVEPGKEDLPDPVFPVALDPELADRQPDDEVIVRGWNNCLTDVKVAYVGAPTAWHLCADGVVLNDTGFAPNVQNWRVEHSPAISSTDWGTVSVMVDVISGRFEGRVFTLLTLNRKVGKIFIVNTINVGEVAVTHSQECLQQKG